MVFLSCISNTPVIQSKLVLSDFSVMKSQPGFPRFPKPAFVIVPWEKLASVPTAF